ncbi:MAG: radical SAM protein [Prevotella sp.]|nr:radical SAM protein [Prevotella sp.]
MYIETTKHNFYSYLRQTGEIVPGIVADDDYVWTFDPNKSFTSMPEVEMFILGVTEQCNLRCKYCCYSGEYQSNRTHSNHYMSKNDIEEIYDFIEKMASVRPLRIAFYGGEPLTRYDFVQDAITKAEERWNKSILFSVTTNATLLSVERIDWLISHHVKMEISIDGTAKFHDCNRIDQAGNGSFYRMYQVLSYIVNEHKDYLPNVQLLMTLHTVEALPAIAEEWQSDPVLRQLTPSHISGLAPNFAKGVIRKDFESLKEWYLTLLDVYEEHQGWSVLKAYFDECLAYWKDRPIVDTGRSVPMSTCMPRNTKLYIDASKQIAVCEKISDRYRIGNIQDGIDWNKANSHVCDYYNKRVERCSHCPSIRVCDLCLTAVEFNDEQWDVLCHNERVYAKLYMLLFCEMAERGLII